MPNTGSAEKQVLKQSTLTGSQRGVLAGLVLATAELFWIGSTSTHPPLLFILYLTTGDVILLGIIGAGVGMISNLWNKNLLSAPVFGIIIGLVYGVNAINHSLVPGIQHAPQKVLAIIFLSAVGLFFAFFFSKIVSPLLGNAMGLASIFLLVLITSFIVSFFFLNRVYLPDVTDPISICTNIILITAAGIIFFVLLHISRKKIGSIEKYDRFSIPFVIVIFIFSVAFTLLNPVSRVASAPATRAFSPSSKEIKETPSILLITLDTLRADHLSCYGYSRKTTRNLDDLADHSKMFRQVVATSPTTLPSHASLFTGLFPSQHGATFVSAQEGGISRRITDRVPHEMAAAPLPDAAVTLTEVLASQGYKCGAIVANCAYLWRGFGIDQGFHYYDDDRGTYIPLKPLFDVRENAYLWRRNRYRFLPYRTATVITGRAIKWIEKNSRHPFFLFLNYMDPHEPYAAPPKFQHIFADNAPAVPLPKGAAFKVMKEGKNLPKEMRQFLMNEYDEEVAYLDAELGRLLVWLQRKHLLDELIVVITSDHGESLGEHSYLGHTNCVYEQEIRVPLLVKYPHSRHAGEKVEGITSLADVPDIILKEINLPRLAEKQPYVISEYPENLDRVRQYGARFEHSLTAIYQGHLKYVIKQPGETEVYDFIADPGESNDLANSQSMPLQMADYLQDLATDFQQKQVGMEGDSLQGGIEERLRSLGYIN